jgi:hypothetical protein
MNNRDAVKHNPSLALDGWCWDYTSFHPSLRRWIINSFLK